MRMFQTYEPPSPPTDIPPRLAAIRAAMAEVDLDALLVPRADVHQGEYVAPSDDRLAWLTGFTGSAGSAVILRDRAALFLDGRYRVQGRMQAPDDIEIVPWPDTSVAAWLADTMVGGRVGFDPWLHPIRAVAKLREALAAKSIGLIPTQNLVDAIWDDRPAPPDDAFFAYPDERAGETASDKRTRLAEELREKGEHAAILTLPDSIAWLLNIRGSDVPRNPVPHAFAILHEDGRVDLFARPGKADRIEVDGVTVLPWDGFEAALMQLSGPVRVDPSSAPQAIADLLDEAGVERSDGSDPVLLPKACKNETEIAGTREAHLRDGAAMVRFLAWLDASDLTALTEIDIATRLERFRRNTNALQDIAFEAIVSTGPNGAINHYRVNEDTNRPLKPGELLLVDSGGQYLDGTTDITRTIPVGEVGDEEKRAFTLVLKGMVTLSRLRFPRGVAGQHIDALARAPLWMAGLDFDHGTGHGVGHYLSVHEGPQRISRLSDVPLEPGMIVSNEPGYYREGAFGIRIENLIVVREAPPLEGADDRAWFDFETLTFVPIDRRLIVAEMLTAEERAWIDAYHAEVAAKIGPRVDGEAAEWLARATAPLA